jgi:hypothetical protein
MCIHLRKLHRKQGSGQVSPIELRQQQHFSNPQHIDSPHDGKMGQAEGLGGRVFSK